MKTYPSKKCAIRYMVILAILVVGFVSYANSDAVGNPINQKIVMFHEGTTSDQLQEYVDYWEAYGVILVDHLPIIKGILVHVPDNVELEDPAFDPIVAGIIDDGPVELQALHASGDGGAGDGGAGDGGAVYTEPIRFITPVDSNIFDDLKRPWGILYMYGQPYSPEEPMSTYDPNALPPIVEEARDPSYLRKIRIAVLDTGVDYTHPKLDNFVEGGIDLVNMTPGIPMDDNGHGSHVAATIVSRRTGLARRAKLYAVKVLDENAVGDVSTIIMGLQWAMQNDMDIVNMSIAFRDDNPAVHLAVKNAYEAGIIMVAAVGNHSNWEEDGAISGDGGAGDGGAGDGGAGDGGAAGDLTVNPNPVMYPAAYPQVLAVSAMTSYGDVAGFSNTGPETDLYAPGEWVISANLMELSKYGECNGTSMATPHATGAVALMLSLKHNLTGSRTNPSPFDVRDILVSTAIDGRLNLTGALEEIAVRYGQN